MQVSNKEKASMPQFTFLCSKQLRSRKHEAVKNESNFNSEI